MPKDADKPQSSVLRLRALARVRSMYASLRFLDVPYIWGLLSVLWSAKKETGRLGSLFLNSMVTYIRYLK